MSVSSRARHALLAAVALAVSTSSAPAQTVPGGVSPLAIEREPPLATKPVFAPPTLIPPAVPGAPVGVSGPPVPPQPIHIPPGPGPVAVPVPAQSPVTVQPVVPPPVSSSAAPATAAPATQAAPSATTAAPPVAPVPATPPTTDRPTSEAPAPASTPAPASSETPSAVPSPQPVPATPPQQGAAPASQPPATEQPAPAAKAKLVIEDVRLETRPAIFVTGTTSWEKAETLFDKVFKDLGDAVGKTGVTPTSGPIVEYVETDDDTIGYRVMVPVAAVPKGKLPKGVKVGETRGGKALLFRNEGPLEDLEEVYARIDDELAKRGLDNAVIVEAYDEDALASPEDRSILNIWVLIR